ncbi:glycosyltransferase family 2 protein [Legionella drozanskii]|uniref:Glycosyltransferase, group 2 family protein (Glycan biosynthesis) n=1 Tax=Legionella drozanskii LLAP-1 TaxID=1212489 RepID=A0A0W0SPZ6_9GAMM|nr:glycosyltransferase family 2 protein [Legionella drozanskii]KTC85478.1 glycosyltransferase, group 2 family protein (glycan biosynthesis) [Legionella drozanskii LLAP-1]
MKYSVIIPIYKNETSILELLEILKKMNHELAGHMEAVFVIDGSPDKSYEIIRDNLEYLNFPAQLLVHSRNFGSFPAIRSGLIAARGKFFGVMAADLQEPPELLITFFKALDADECDVAIGTRNGRQDPFLSRMAANLFWGLYRRLIISDMPPGGVDVFGCNQQFRDQLLQLEESRSSLIALIFWLGFRRKLVHYERQKRQNGKSAWTFRKKLDYMMDSIFAFTDYPIRLLIRTGAVGTVFALGLGALIFSARIMGMIVVPGYAAIILTVLLLGALNMFGLGLIGTYAWRGYENSKQRPLAVVALKHINEWGH